MIELFWELHQQRGIADAKSAAAGGASDARTALSAVRTLESRVNALLLANMALWSLLQERLKIGDDVLNERIREIDLRDGRLDGRVAATVGQCSSCNRAMSPRHTRCIYCGADSVKSKPFGA